MTAVAELARRGELEVDVPLAGLTTYRLGGRARYLLRTASEDDLTRLGAALAADAAAGRPHPLLVLGRGSNLVVSDKGFAGVVVRLGQSFATIDVRDDGVVAAGGAAHLPTLARRAVDAGRGGLEFYVGVPGAVGGAVVMNASCRGTATADVMLRARIVDLASGTAGWDTPGGLELGYRHSRLTATDVVVAAEFRTQPVDPAEGRRLMRELTRWRKETQPGGTHTAGSVFKNPPGDHAGRLIDALGLKGMRRGGAVVSERHANFFEADAGATAQDVYDLVAAVRVAVEEQTGIRLEPEIRFAGDFGAGGT